MSGCFCFSSPKPAGDSMSQKYPVIPEKTAEEIAKEEEEKKQIEMEKQKEEEERQKAIAIAKAEEDAAIERSIKAAEAAAKAEAEARAAQEAAQKQLYEAEQAKMKAIAIEEEAKAAAKSAADMKAAEEAEKAAQAAKEAEEKAAKELYEAEKALEEAAAKAAKEAKELEAKKKKSGRLPSFGSQVNTASNVQYFQELAAEDASVAYLKFKAMQAINKSDYYDADFKHDFENKFDIQGGFVQDYNDFLAKQQQPVYTDENGEISYKNIINQFMKKENFVFDGKSFVPDPQTGGIGLQRQKSYEEFPNQDELNYSFMPQTVVAYDNFGNLIPILNATQGNADQVPFASYTPHPDGGILAYDEDGNTVQFPTDQTQWGGQVKTFIPSGGQIDADQDNYTQYYPGYTQDGYGMANDDAQKAFIQQTAEFANNNFNYSNNMDDAVAEKLASKVNPESGSYLPEFSVDGKKKQATKKKSTMKGKKTKKTVKASQAQMNGASQEQVQQVQTSVQDEAILLPKKNNTYQLMSLEEFTNYVQDTGYKGVALKVHKNDPESIKYAMFVAQNLSKERSETETTAVQA